MRNPISSKYWKKAISLCVMVTFTLTGFNIPLAYADVAPTVPSGFRLPAPGVMVHLSPPMNPPMLKGIKVHADNPFRFDFILDKGESWDVGQGSGQGDESLGKNPKDPTQRQNPQPKTHDTFLKEESTKLIKYFLASLTIPEQDLWVNLSPYEKDRIIPNSFGLTEMGRDLLAQDYMLKQITASLIYPEDEIGKRFWKRIYEEAAKKYGTTNIPVNTFNKVWIVPEKAVVYENAKAGTAYVVESRLKVMLETDYLAMEHNVGARHAVPVQGQDKDVNQIGSQIIRQIVIPELTKEINENQNFAQLRQVYNSLILATWYKKKIKDSILARVYADRNKIAGIKYNNSVVPERFSRGPSAVANPGSPIEAFGDDKKNDVELIYQRYLSAFKKGVYNYIKEDLDSITQQPIPRKYFSGGVKLDLAMRADSAMQYTTHVPNNLDNAMQITADIEGLATNASAVTSVKINALRLQAIQQKANFNLKKPKTTLAKGEFSEDIILAIQILNKTLSDTEELGKLLTILSALREKFSYTNVINSAYTPLEYMDINKIDFIPFNDAVSVLETTESFRRHILRIKIAPDKFVNVEIKIPGDEKPNVSDADFQIPQDAQDQYGADNFFQRPLIKAETTGEIELYGKNMTFNENLLRVVVFEHIDAKRIYDVSRGESLSSGLRIDETYLKTILKARNETDMGHLKENIFLQIINQGAMILDMGLEVYENNLRTYSVISTDLHLGNFALTRQGKVYFVSDNASFKKSIGKKVQSGAGYRMDEALGLDAVDTYWFYNRRAESLTELVGPLLQYWTDNFKSLIKFSFKDNPASWQDDLYLDNLRIGSREFHQKFSGDIAYYRQVTTKTRDNAQSAQPQPGRAMRTEGLDWSTELQSIENVKSILKENHFELIQQYDNWEALDDNQRKFFQREMLKIDLKTLSAMGLDDILNKQKVPFFEGEYMKMWDKVFPKANIRIVNLFSQFIAKTHQLKEIEYEARLNVLNGRYITAEQHEEMHALSVSILFISQDILKWRKERWAKTEKIVVKVTALDEETIEYPVHYLDFSFFQYPLRTKSLTAEEKKFRGLKTFDIDELFPSEDEILETMGDFLVEQDSVMKAGKENSLKKLGREIENSIITSLLSSSIDLPEKDRIKFLKTLPVLWEIGYGLGYIVTDINEDGVAEGILYISSRSMLHFLFTSEKHAPIETISLWVNGKREIEINATEIENFIPVKLQDAAMRGDKVKSKDIGGIDLTPANMNLQTQGSNGEIKFHLDPAMLQQLQNAPGFTPVIINIQPMTDLRQFLGLNVQEVEPMGVG